LTQVRVKSQFKIDPPIYIHLSIIIQYPYPKDKEGIAINGACTPGDARSASLVYQPL